MDALAIIFFVSGTDERISLIDAYRASTIRIFFNLITPFSAGGQPMMVYAISRAGISPGKSSSVAVTKLITYGFFNQCGAVTAFMLFHNKISRISIVNTAFLITGILFFVSTCFIVLAFLRPGLMIPLITRVCKLLCRLKLLKNAGQLRHKIIKEIRLAQKSLKQYFSHHTGYFICGILFNCLVYCSEVLMLWIILKSFGIDMKFIEGITLSALIMFLMSFMPTPGSAGLGEGIFVLLMSGTVPGYILGIAVICWRLFYRYLSGIIGAAFSAKSFSSVLIKDRK